MTVLSWVFILIMVAVNAVFAAYEIALASVTLGRLKALADQQRKGARTALGMKQNMEASLAVVQLGITLVGALAAATGGAGADESLAPWLADQLGISQGTSEVLALALFVIPLAAVTIVVGELIPKVWALKHKEFVCLKLSPPMKLLSIVAHPAVWVLETAVTALMAWGDRRWRPGAGEHKDVTEMQELRAVVALARTSRLIGGQEEKIILGAARLSNRSITEIMIPVEDMVTLDLEHTMSESLVIAHQDMHTRFPVCAKPGDRQSILGYVNFKDIVSELRLSPDQPNLAGIMRAIPDLSDKLTIANSLERLIRGHVHIAIVRDSNGAVVGMITLEDILEEIVGEIEDEYDRAPTHLVESGTGWIMGGGVTLDRVEQVTGRKLDRQNLPPDTRTLDDWIMAVQGRAPKGGDIVRTEQLRVIVRKVRRQLVLEAQVHRVG